jgi:MFS family permease
MADQLSRDEKFIVSQSPEFIDKVNPIWIKKIISAFPALANKNYRLYFWGQLISLSGTWLQIVAQGWLVLHLTTSPYIIGLIAACATLPSLLFTLFGGVIVDRFSKKKVLLCTQIIAMLLAFALGILTLLGWVTLIHIGAIAFLLGTVNAIDAPARQSFVIEIANKEQLPSAIALNSGVFNAARALGPGVAGILIATIGTGGAFIINGISYIAVITALLLMKIKSEIAIQKTHPITAIKEGLSYSYKHPVIRTLLIFAGLVSVFGWSYTTLLPLIAKNVFMVGAKELGYFYVATGTGSLIAAILVALASKKITTTLLIIGGNCLFTIGLFLFTLTTNFYIALVLLFFVGAGLVGMASTINLTIQKMVKNEFRGRVMSIYVLMFIGFIPIGNFQIGYVSEHFGTSIAIQLGSLILFVFGILLLLAKNKIRSGFNEYKQNEVTI